MHHHKSNKKEFEIRPIPLWILLLCGVVIMSIGVYVYFQHEIIVGRKLEGKYGRAGSPVVLTWHGITIIGIVLTALSAYLLVKQKEKRLHREQGTITQNKL